MSGLAGISPLAVSPVGPVAATPAIELVAPRVDVAADALPEHTARTPASPLLPLLPLLPSAAALMPDLSATAQRLSQWLSVTAPVTEAPASLRALLPSPETQPAKIAAALHQAVTHSGLFYESHLGDWVDGKRSLDMLCQEPQVRLPSPAGSTDAEAAGIVRQQLDLLDTQQLNWRGELWPGLPVTLQLNREDERQQPDRHAQAPDAEDSVWRTTLVSTLPHLGEVTLRLRFANDRLQLALHSSSDARTGLLLRHVPALAHALQQAGIVLEPVAGHGQKAG